MVAVVDDAYDGELDLAVVEPLQAVGVRGEYELVLASPADQKVVQRHPGLLRYLVHIRLVLQETELDVYAYA